nr:MAG TPA: hypothetical protein [Caudoviricetes sp.]DAX50107.1 MAG TPA: hypothetical protein [Caudoviricetes sp.]
MCLIFTIIQVSNEAQKTKKAVTPTKNEPPPIKKRKVAIL